MSGLDTGIGKALEVMSRVGITATCQRDGDARTTTAIDDSGHIWRVKAAEPFQSVMVLLEKLEFTNLD